MCTPIREGIETMPEYLKICSDKSISINCLCDLASIILNNNFFKNGKTCSDKSISINSLCDLASIILNNNSFKNGELKYHKKRGTAIGTKFAPPYSNLFMAGLEREFFKTVSLNLSCSYDTLMTFLVYEPKVPKY